MSNDGFRAAPEPDEILDFDTLEDLYGHQLDTIEPVQSLVMTNASMKEAAKFLSYGQVAMEEGNEGLAELLVLAGSKLAYQCNLSFLLLQAYAETLDEKPGGSEQAADGVRAAEQGPPQEDPQVLGSIRPSPDHDEGDD